jgi:hypothetical protein
LWEESSDKDDRAGDEIEMENANPQIYQGNGNGGNKYQKDEGTERNDSPDGNNGNGDENDGGGEEVGVEEGEEKNPNDEGSDQDDRAGDEKMLIMIHHHLCHHLVHLISATGHKKSTATCLNLHHSSARKMNVIDLSITCVNLSGSRGKSMIILSDCIAVFTTQITLIKISQRPIMTA